MLSIWNEAFLTVICINILVGWSFWLPLATGQLSMTTPGTVAVGAYGASRLAVSGVTNPLVLIMTGAAAGLALMIFVSPLTLRLKGYSFALATLGISECVRLVFNNLDYFGGSAGIAGIPPSTATLPIACAVCVLLFLLAWSIYRGNIGRMIDATRNDELQATSLGVSVAGVRMSALLMQGLVGGTAGALLSSYVGYIDPSQFSLALLLDAFAYVVVGGMYTFIGPFLGAIVLTVLLQYFSVLENARNVAFGLLLLVIIRVRKDGLLPRGFRARRRRLRRLLEHASAMHEGEPVRNSVYDTTS